MGQKQTLKQVKLLTWDVLLNRHHACWWLMGNMRWNLLNRVALLHTF